MPAGGAIDGDEFRQLFEQAPGLYLVLDPYDGYRCLGASDAYLRATLTTRETVIGRLLFDVFPDNPDDLSADGVNNLRASLDRVVAHGHPDAMPTQKYDVRRPDGDAAPFEERYWNPLNSPVFGPDGRLQFIVHQVDDVTEFVRLQQEGIEQSRAAQELRLRTSQMEREISRRNGELAEWRRENEELNRTKLELERSREREAQLRHAQKLESLGVLAGGIAHDFNNLLVSVLGNAEIARLQIPDDSPAHDTIAAIDTAAQRAADLTRQLLAYSGKGRFSIEAVDLSRIVREMGNLLDVSLSKRARMDYALADSLPPIEADATQIRQAIMNLITNAADAVSERHGGRVLVSTGRMHADRAYLSESYLDDDLPAGEYVLLEVADNGIGMTPETLARIFDPFFTTKSTGRGLGMAAVIGIVRGHRGALKVYSEPGKGTNIKVLFPVADNVEQPAPIPRPVWKFGHSGLVLVVDDDPTVREVTLRILATAGVPTLSAQDGREALDLYREQAASIAVVLLDLTMPSLDGEETFRLLRRLNPDIRVILTSGYHEQDATARFVGKGLAGFIQKPFRRDELLQKLREALDGG